MYKKIMASLTVTAMCICSIVVVEAAASPKVDRTVRNIKMTLNNCAIDQYWDGNAIKPGVLAEVTNGWLHSCVSNLNRAISYYNSLNAMERMSPSVVSKDIKGRLDSYQKFAKAAQDNQQVAAASAQAAQNTCMTFGQFANVPKTKEIERLAIVQATGSGPYIVPKDFEPLKQAAEKAHKICTENPAIAKLGDNSCPMYRINGNGAEWCSAAANYKKLMPELLFAYAKANLTKIPDKPEIIVDWQHQGWLRVNGKAEYERLFTVTEDEKAELAQKLASPVEIIGDPSVLNKVYDIIAQEREPFKKKIDEYAPTWKTTNISNTKSYLQNIAREIIMDWHPKAKIIKNFISSTGYQVKRNELGVIIDRRLHGGIVYQLPGEPWCQYRVYSTREPYNGNNSYGKGTHYNIDMVRFQSCKN
jgi:hypothetical protein